MLSGARSGWSGRVVFRPERWRSALSPVGASGAHVTGPAGRGCWRCTAGAGTITTGTRCSSGLDAVALDLPGHGVAPEPPEPWSTRQYAEWVAPRLADFGGGPVVIAGHSFGARVAVQLAAASGEDLGAGPTAARASGPSCWWLHRSLRHREKRSSRPSLIYRAGRTLHRIGFVPDDRMEQLAPKHGSDDYRQASPVMRGVLVRAASETASAAYVPPLRPWASDGGAVELVWGERDTEASFAGVIAQLDGVESRHPHGRPGSWPSHEPEMVGKRAAPAHQLTVAGQHSSVSRPQR